MNQILLIIMWAYVAITPVVALAIIARRIKVDGQWRGKILAGLAIIWILLFFGDFGLQ